MSEVDSKKNVFVNIIWKFMEQGGISLMTFVMNVILARILSPADFGVVGIITVFITISNVFINGGFSNALIQKKKAEEIDYSSVFYISLVVSIICYVILFISAPFIASFYKEPILKDILRIQSLTIVFGVYNSVATAKLQREMRFRSLFVRSFAAVIMASVIGISSAINGRGIWSLVYYSVSQTVLNSLILIVTVRWYPYFEFSVTRVKAMFSFGYKLLISNIIDTLYNNIYSLVIGKIYTKQTLGYYNKGKNFSNMIITNINSSIQAVMLPVLSRKQDNSEEIKQVVRKSIKMSCFIIFPCMAGLAGVSVPLVRLLLTEKWLPCVPFICFCCANYAFWPVHTTNLQAITAMGRSDIFLKLEIVKKVIGVMGLIISAPFGIYTMMWVRVMTTFSSFIVNSYPNKKLLKYGFKEQMIDILPNLVISLFMGVAVYVLGKILHFYDAVNLVIMIVAGIIIYVVLSAVFMRDIFNFSMGYVKSFSKRTENANTLKMTEGWKDVVKKLLIIGANPETASLVKKANDMGIVTYVTDNNPNAYAKMFADKPCNVDGTDVDGLVELVRKEKIDGVLVGVAEALIPTYCEVCKRLNYPCFATLEQFEIMIKKHKFKDTCRRYGVPTVPEFSQDNLDKVEYPVVVKPVDSCSSKGVSICTNREELDNAVKKALDFSVCKKFLIEKYMAGLEVIMYYIIQDGVPSFVAMCDRYTSKEQKGITQLPSAYIFPSKHIERFKKETDEKVCNMLRQMHIENGVLFLQAFLDDDGSVKIYEPGFRLNGAQEHMIVSYLTEIDAKELLINYALTGRMWDKKVSDFASPDFRGEWACKLSPLVKEGKIGRFVGIDEISESEGVISVNPNYIDGDVVKGLGTQRQMAANIFIAADTKFQLKDRVDRVIELFDVLDENGLSMMLKPFDTKNILN